MKSAIILLGLLLSASVLASTSAVNEVMQSLQTTGAKPANAQHGQQLWNQTHNGKPPFTERSCTSCHGNDLATTGKHVRTGKPIEPLAPSVNNKSLTEVRKINKWLKRNCKWTLGRECTAQEKADILSFISQQ